MPFTYTALTTMVAVLLLIISGIRPVIDFGWMMTMAVGMALFLGFFILPAGLLLLPKSRKAVSVSGLDKEGGFTDYFANLTEMFSQLMGMPYTQFGSF